MSKVTPLISHRMVSRAALCSSLFLALATAGRADIGPVPETSPPYSAADYTSYETPGTVSFHATFFIEGDRLHLGYPRVRLWAFPDSAYTRWFVTRYAYCLEEAAHCKTPNLPTELAKLVRTTSTDKDGKFHFINMNPGKYVIFGQKFFSGSEQVQTSSPENVFTDQGAFTIDRPSEYTLARSTVETYAAVATLTPTSIYVPVFRSLSVVVR
jgi:hypothetical protein